MARRLEVEIVGDARSLNRALGSAESSTKGLGSKFGHLGRTAAFAAGAAGVGAVAFAVKDVVGDMLEGQKVTAQTNAVLRSTGKVAGVSSTHVQDLAQKIQFKSGMDDEAVQSGENLLLTFTNIRNEAGKGNNIFDQTTEIMADMSAALGQDASTSAIQLGKALQDPISGLTALRRVGVSFTDGQKQQIKALVESGKSMQAQKLILHELNKEFGGSAEAAGKTLPGQLSIVKAHFEAFSEELITKALPYLQQFRQYIVARMPEIKKAIRDVFEWLKVNVFPTLRELGKTAYQVFSSIKAAIQNNWGTIKPILDALIKIIKVVSKVALFELRLEIKAVTVVLNFYIAALRTVREVVGKVAAAVTGAYKTIKGAVDGAGAAILESWRAMGRALDTVQNLLIWIRDHGAGVFRVVWKVIEKPIHALNDAVRALGAALGKVRDVFNWLLGKAKAIGGFFGGIAGAVGGAAKRVGDASGQVQSGAGGAGTTASSAAAGRAFGVGPQLWDEIAIGQRFGLHVTSGFRPGARTKHGTLSDHARHAAVDMAGPPAGMAATFRALLGRTEVKQAFYDPLGSIFNGMFSSYREGGHSDHIHIAEYDRGGILPPGLTLAMNNTGRNEMVLAPGAGGGPRPIVIMLDGRELARGLVDPLRNEVQVIRARTGKAVLA